jgi:hypothetical protein
VCVFLLFPPFSSLPELILRLNFDMFTFPLQSARFSTLLALADNDSLVSEVPKEDVFKDTKGDTNPYFLVFVRQDRLCVSISLVPM